MESSSAQSSVLKWERDDPHYRVIVFSGPENEAATYDLPDLAVEQVWETVRVVAQEDSKLWSLALLERDDSGAPGLLWLSGMDYGRAPVSARDWRRRGEMQDRYLAAQAEQGQTPTLPNGLRLIRLFPEWGTGSPLWENGTDDYNLDGKDLGLSAALSADLSAWSAQWGERDEDDETLPPGWLDRGMELWGRVQDELDGIAEVRPEFLE
ncbi:hypothetical protein [Leucobacter luti]|uniref:hypothetical protein n=1 Tax=Leucobacter luti TaxID=340320 RepID=UPI001C68F8B4|nr:hypothetical protein [Leucobacter luti]QYM76005.1 hypothetical protein K1X41_00465 [Leucobacter luti]